MPHIIACLKQAKEMYQAVGLKNASQPAIVQLAHVLVLSDSNAPEKMLDLMRAAIRLLKDGINLRLDQMDAMAVVMLASLLAGLEQRKAQEPPPITEEDIKGFCDQMVAIARQSAGPSAEQWVERIRAAILEKTGKALTDDVLADLLARIRAPLPHAIQAGDVVMQDGATVAIAMTVERVEGDTAVVVWFDFGEKHQESLPIASLKRAVYADTVAQEEAQTEVDTASPGERVEMLAEESPVEQEVPTPDPDVAHGQTHASSPKHLRRKPGRPPGRPQQ